MYWFEDEIAIYIAMAYYREQDLEKHIRRHHCDRDGKPKPVIEMDGIVIMEQVLQALKFLHRNSIVHADLHQKVCHFASLA